MVIKNDVTLQILNSLNEQPPVAELEYDALYDLLIPIKTLKYTMPSQELADVMSAMNNLSRKTNGDLPPSVSEFIPSYVQPNEIFVYNVEKDQLESPITIDLVEPLSSDQIQTINSIYGEGYVRSGPGLYPIGANTVYAF